MTPAPHDMPVLDAYTLSGVFEGHYRAAFPEGERSYPSADAIRLAAARIGAAVRIHDRPVSTPAAVDPTAGSWGTGARRGSRRPTRTPVKASVNGSDSPGPTRR